MYISAIFIAIIFLVSPQNSISINPVTVSAELHDSAEFTCLSMGGPDNTYMWVHVFSSQTVGYQSTLSVPSVQAIHGGEYRCTVTNAAGNDSSESVLYG